MNIQQFKSNILTLILSFKKKWKNFKNNFFSHKNALSLYCQKLESPLG
jgi:hypothetical protein